VVVVVAVLDHLALVVEMQHRHSRVAEFLALLGPAGPPFHRGPLTRHDRLPKPALDILLGRELLAEIAPDASQAQVGLAERGERYTTVSAYSAAMASASRCGQARDQVSAQRRAAVSASMPAIQTGHLQLRTLDRHQIGRSVEHVRSVSVSPLPQVAVHRASCS
jgi:hypothetical protein